MSLLHIWHHSLHVGCIVENDLVIIGAHKWENDGYLFVLVSWHSVLIPKWTDAYFMGGFFSSTYSWGSGIGINDWSLFQLVIHQTKAATCKNNFVDNI